MRERETCDIQRTSIALIASACGEDRKSSGSSIISLGRNAFGFRSRVAATACLRSGSVSQLLQQPEQLHASLQSRPLAKHSQYLSGRETEQHQYCNNNRMVVTNDAGVPQCKLASEPPGNQLQKQQHGLRETHSLRHLDFLQLHGLKCRPTGGVSSTVLAGRFTGVE